MMAARLPPIASCVPHVYSVGMRTQWLFAVIAVLAASASPSQAENLAKAIKDGALAMKITVTDVGDAGQVSAKEFAVHGHEWTQGYSLN